jgi:hypothetical protein
MLGRLKAYYILFDTFANQKHNTKEIFMIVHRLLRRAAAPTLLALCLSGAAHAGTWTPVANNPFDGCTTALLLTDGTVLVEGNTYHQWFKLTPDSAGNYANGSWSQVANCNIGRWNFASAVLRDGRVFIGGGEYFDNPNNISAPENTTEIYDPVANTWTMGPNGLFGAIGDCGAVELPDGRMFFSTWNGPYCQLYNPADGSLVAGPNMPSGVSGDEESWALLPDGSVLNAYSPNPLERYLPSSNTWVLTANCPVTLTTNGEMGPALPLYNGKCLTIGSTGHTALYNVSNNTWQKGPDLQGGDQDSDAPAVIEPSGKVIIVSSAANDEYGVANFNEYDPSSNTIARIPGPTYLGRSDLLRFLCLPNGQILLTTYGNPMYVYTPDGSPNSGWRPSITSISASGGQDFTLTGTQLNGLSLGAAYGDENQMATNYPIVKLVSSSGQVTYCKTLFPSNMSIASQSASNVTFNVPGSVASGNYTVYVVANSISSNGFAWFYPGASTVQNGVYAITAKTTGNVLDCNGCSNANGTQVDLWSYWGGSCQQWAVSRLSNGNYSIRNLNSDGSAGRALDCTGCSPNDGTQLQLWDYWAGPCQTWQITSQADGFSSISSAQAKSDGTYDVIDGNGCSGLMGTAAILWSWDGGACQQEWTFVPVNPPALVSGAYYTLTNVAAGMNLDDPGGSSTPGTVQQFWPSNGATGQAWKLTQQSDGSYTLTNQAANLNLADPNGSTKSGTQQQILAADGSTAQEWRITPTVNGAYKLTNVASSLCLTSPSGGVQGSKVQVGTANNSTSQQWRLTPQ